MIRIANLEIDPIALDYCPESLAREECVLPLRLEGNAFRVAIGRRDDYQDLLKKLRFITNRRIFWAVADRQALDWVIDEVYTYRATEVTNCPIEAHLDCPRQWLNLQPTDRPVVRFCRSCQRKVYLCMDQAEAVEYAELARRVAIYNVADNLDRGSSQTPDFQLDSSAPRFRRRSSQNWEKTAGRSASNCQAAERRNRGVWDGPLDSVDTILYG